MNRHNYRSIPLPRPSAVLAVIFIIPALTIAYYWLSGPQIGDWVGYAQLYDSQVDWLTDEGRDPGFVAFLNISREIFGTNQYIIFREAFYIVVLVFATWLAAKLPMQKNLPRLSSVLVAIVVVTIFFLKGFVQIREGLAIMLIAIPLVTAYTTPRRAGLLVGVGALAGATFHVGTGFVFLAWAIAVGLQLLPNSTLARPTFQRVLACGTLFVGVALAYTLSQHASAIRFLLADAGVDATAKLRSGAAKTAYWAANGLLVYEVRRELLNSAQFLSTRFSYCFSSVFASGVLPAIYGLTATLVFLDFPVPAFTTLGLRLFYTATELGLLIVLLRGSGTSMTLLAATFMLVDRVRLVMSLL